MSRRIVAQLTGLQAELPIDFDHVNLVLKFLMYHRLVDFLASALNTIRPPPPEPGGLLGALLATNKGATSEESNASNGD
jgi:hypothetical protein